LLRFAREGTLHTDIVPERDGSHLPAKNIHHDAVVDALKADGWTITHDPLTLSIGVRRLYVDLGADKGAVAAEKEGRRIAVEVQSFLSNSDIDDLQHAIGQYILYRILLGRIDPDRVLYLAVPDDAYRGILSEEVGKLVRAELKMPLIAFDPKARRITQWTS